MRKLTQAKMLSLLESNQDSIARAISKLEPLFTPLVNAHTLTHAVSEGFINVNTIELDGEEIGCIWWHASCNGELVVNACASIKQDDNFPAFVAAAKLIAKARNCKYVKFETIRPGMAMKAVTLGFKVSGLILSCAV